MKLKLRLSRERKDQIVDELNDLGIVVSEESELILTEENYNAGEIYCKDDTDRVVVSLSEIVFIESMGKKVYVHTKENVYTTSNRLYEMEKKLPQEQFIRISNSVIIGRHSIKWIIPALSQKYYLTLKSGDKVDVTRTYYYKFKEFYGI